MRWPCSGFRTRNGGRASVPWWRGPAGSHVGGDRRLRPCAPGRVQAATIGEFRGRDLPKTGSGKVLKRELRATFRAPTDRDKARHQPAEGVREDWPCSYRVPATTRVAFRPQSADSVLSPGVDAENHRETACTDGPDVEAILGVKRCGRLPPALDRKPYAKGPH